MGKPRPNGKAGRLDVAAGEQLKQTATILEQLGARSIVFVGMMGSGKSAIGRLLAQELALPYADSDAEIEAAADMSVPEIFSNFGEEYFRNGEQRVILRLLSAGPTVLSLGGGAFLAEATRDEIRCRAVSIWLKADIDLLLSRVMRKPHVRPLLKTPDPRATLCDLLEKRGPVYATADIHIESSRVSRQQTCSDVSRALYDWLAARPPQSSARSLR